MPTERHTHTERERENESEHNENRAQNYNNKRWQRQQTNKQTAVAGGLRIHPITEGERLRANYAHTEGKCVQKSRSSVSVS